MAIVVARMIASLEAETSQFHGRMTAAEQQLAKWGSATATGSRSTIVLRNAVQQLAFQAAGIPGPVGKAASAIGVLGLGTGPVMLAVAALGALAIAYSKLMEISKAAAKAQEDFLRSLSGVGPHAKALAAQVELSLAQQKMASMRARQDRATVAGVVLTGGLFTVGGFSPEQMEAQQREVARLTIAAADAEREAADATRERTKEIRQQNHERAEQNRLIREARLETLLSTPEGRAAFLRGTVIPIKGGTIMGEESPVGKNPTPEKFLPREHFLQEAVKEAGKIRTASEAMQIAQIVAGGLVMAMQGGGAAGTAQGLGMFATGLAGLKGVGAAAGPLGWIGLGLTTLGSLFGDKMDRKEIEDERRHRELIGVLHEGPARVVNMFDQGGAETSLYEMRRQERLGGEPRNGGL